VTTLRAERATAYGRLTPDLDALEHLTSTISSEAAGDDTSGEGLPELDATSIAELPRAVRTRVLRAWARRHGAGALSAAHTSALDALVSDWHGQGPVDLPGVRVARSSGKLVLNPPPHDPQE